MLKNLAVSALFVGAGLVLGMGVPQTANATIPRGHSVTECVQHGRDGTQLCTVYWGLVGAPMTAQYYYYLYANGSRSPIFVSPDL